MDEWPNNAHHTNDRRKASPRTLDCQGCGWAHLVPNFGTTESVTCCHLNARMWQSHQTNRMSPTREITTKRCQSVTCTERERKRSTRDSWMIATVTHCRKKELSFFLKKLCFQEKTKSWKEKVGANLTCSVLACMNHTSTYTRSCSKSEQNAPRT